MKAQAAGQNRPRGVIISFLALTFLLSACVTSGESDGSNGSQQGTATETPTSAPSPSGSSSPVLASTTTTSTEAGANLRIDIHSLQRQKNDTVVLELSLKNLGSEEDASLPNPPLQGEGSADVQPFSLIDGSNRKKHLPLLYSEGACYCSDWSEASVESSNSVSGWIAFPAPPDNVKSMIFVSAIAPPILDIPLSQTGKKVEHPAREDLAAPEIWDVRSLEGDLAGNTREETGDEVSISLSTDVLFAVGKSILTDKAQDKLRQVALEIDNSPGKTVKIDGHTDDSGNESINNPLAVERAQAVEESLSSMVNRSGVEFDAEGHGSDEPIATNETEEGRKKNRRVTITFAS
ncbi:OmpA family protein [Streptomonospora wellingtoniae]|uniref:OmpA family protein n=1 Tax=Streptomonospora wellingtoniae TaxID=3075544 RepID=A0ABU2KXS9_9ACTN|nr:OmpA family protein [Streptomonospora sp. DSM 45055]MDT0304115.1 OmpA family protein [Streptomonospora sp. DSM 45055]